MPKPSNTSPQHQQYHQEAQDLPPGWGSMIVDGRTLYFNHETETTQWERPQFVDRRETHQRAAYAPSVDWNMGLEPSEGSLAPGWEAMPMAGRILYVNHARKRTQWERPVNPAEVQREPLPPGWEAVMMGDRILYVNHSQRKTQWERPKMRGHVRQEQLPFGWETKIVGGRTLYVNHINRVTQWERPTGQASPSAPFLSTSGGGGGNVTWTGSQEWNPQVDTSKLPRVSLGGTHSVCKDAPMSHAPHAQATAPPPPYAPHSLETETPPPYTPGSPTCSSRSGPLRPDVAADFVWPGPSVFNSAPGEMQSAKVPVLSSAGDGTIGFMLYNDFFPLYGPEVNTSHVKDLTISRESGQSRGINGLKGFTWEFSKTRSASAHLKNLVFACSDYNDTDGPFYVQAEWKPNMSVRLLLPGALRGYGCLLNSSRGRVYVLNETIPRLGSRAKRGYLKVERHGMVEHFLDSFGWRSRCESPKKVKTNWGTNPAFVVKDKISLNSKGYYVTCRLSGSIHGRLFCQLTPLGTAMEVLSHAGIIPVRSELKFGVWAQRHYGGETFLFD